MKKEKGTKRKMGRNQELGMETLRGKRESTTMKKQRNKKEDDYKTKNTENLTVLLTSLWQNVT
jgi:hypothetical protein